MAINAMSTYASCEGVTEMTFGLILREASKMVKLLHVPLDKGQPRSLQERLKIVLDCKKELNEKDFPAGISCGSLGNYSLHDLHLMAGRDLHYAFPDFLAPPYNFPVTAVRLTNLLSFIISLLATLVAGPLIDGVIKNMSKKNGGIFGKSHSCLYICRKYLVQFKLMFVLIKSIQQSNTANLGSFVAGWIGPLIHCSLCTTFSRI